MSEKASSVSSSSSPGLGTQCSTQTIGPGHPAYDSPVFSFTPTVSKGVKGSVASKSVRFGGPFQ